MTGNEHRTASEWNDAVEDPLSLLMVIDPSIEFSRRDGGGDTAYVAHDPRTGKYFRFGAREYHVAAMMDGNRSLRNIHQQLIDEGLPWGEADLFAFARELAKHRIATLHSISASRGAGATSSERAASQPTTEGIETPPPANRKTWKNLPLRWMGGLLTQRFPIADGDRIATALTPAFGWMFSKAATLCWIPLVGTGVGIVWSAPEAFSAEVRRVFDQQLWLLIAMLWIVLKLVHECGHAVCAKRHGVRVGKMGVILFLFAPLAFVDVTHAWKLHRRRDRVQIALAGIYVELAISALAAWVWWLSPVGLTKHLAAQVFLVAGPATLLVNANPLLRLDGYYVLSDLLEIPNLRSHGRQRLIGWIEAIGLGLPIPESPIQGWRRSFAALHAFCSVVFQIVWMSGLIFAVSAWAEGIGVILAVIATICWALVPLLCWVHKIWTLQPNSGWRLTIYQKRLIAWAGAFGLVIQFASVHSSPFARRVPVVVRFQNEQIARAPVGAFVSAIYFGCGDHVEEGMLLMELHQPELSLKRDQLLDRRDIELGKSIQHRRRSELALAEAAAENAASLGRQIGEINEQLESLRIIAGRSGMITTPGTDRLLGSYVSQGDELLRVSDPHEKEVLAVVSEDNLEAYKQARATNQLAQIRLRGGVTIETKLSMLEPSANRTLPHPAMAATVGGPLAVESTRSDSVELVQTQLRSILPLDPLASLSVKAGQIGRLTLPDDRTLVSRLWDRVKVR